MAKFYVFDTCDGDFRTDPCDFGEWGIFEDAHAWSDRKTAEKEREKAEKYWRREKPDAAFVVLKLVPPPVVKNYVLKRVDNEKYYCSLSTDGCSSRISDADHYTRDRAIRQAGYLDGCYSIEYKVVKVRKKR